MVTLKDLKVLVIEDDISESLDLLMKLESIGVQNIVTASTFEDSVEKIKTAQYDIAFVDIMLNHQEKGLELAELLSLKSTPFITTTNVSDLSLFYDFKKYSPVAYFRKPIDPLELRFRLEFFAESQNKPKSNFLFHKNGTEYIKIEKDNILYVEADGNYATVYTKKEKKFIIRSSLKSLLQKIDSSALMQIHRKWVIRLELIDSYDNQTKKAVMGDLKFPVGRKFQSKLTKHLVNA